MATLFVPSAVIPPKIKAGVQYLRNENPILDANGDLAIGRKIIVLGKDLSGATILVATTLTDNNGNYSVPLYGGLNDKYIIIGVGRNDLNEYSRILGNMTAVR
jgi:hypothetical protein